MDNVASPGKAVHLAIESSPTDNHESLCGKTESSTESHNMSMQVTKGLKSLLQHENSDLKIRIKEQEKNIMFCERKIFLSFLSG